MTKEQTEPEKDFCPCKANCPRHGKCYECVMHHLKPEMPKIINCMRPKAADLASKAIMG